MYMHTYRMQIIQLLDQTVILFSLLNNDQTVIESDCAILSPSSLYERSVYTKYALF